jgi:hypothetical protein
MSSQPMVVSEVDSFAARLSSILTADMAPVSEGLS